MGAADELIGQCVGAGINSYRRSAVMALAGLAADPWALGGSELFPFSEPMRNVVIVSAVSILWACIPSDHDAPAESWDAALRAELLRRSAEDQAARQQLTDAMQSGIAPDSNIIARIVAVDSANTAWFRAAVEERGWPDLSSVGAEGATAAFLLVQHADRDTAFQAAVLPLIEAAYTKGEAQGQHFAMLTDRLATARGLPQVYGTQAAVVDGRAVLKEIADSAGLDARREALGMPPIREYMRGLDSLLGNPPQ